MTNKLKEALFLLSIFKNNRKGITLKTISALLHVSDRSAFRRLNTLREAGLPLYKTELKGETYYTLLLSEKGDFSEIFDYIKPE